MTKKIPTVAIVGRTNVGKSTLFNAIAGRRVSIVENSPGVTRDRHYFLSNRYGFPFTLIDTGGIAGEQEVRLSDAVRTQTEIAISESDLIIALFDGISGVHPLDAEVVDTLRRCEKPVLWVINKCESPNTQLLANDFYALGIEELHFIAAAHRQGVADLCEKIRVLLGVEKQEENTPVVKTRENEIRVAVLGRPNVGKSSIINRILGEERLIASDLAGTTRDAIDIKLTRDGKDFVIVDTAGLRKKARVDDATIERYSNLRTLKALASSDVAVLILDATDGAPMEQDTKVAGLIHERGRPLVLVVNKWDAIEKDHLTVRQFEKIVRNGLKFTAYAPIIYVSAKTGQRCPKILETVRQVYDNAQVRIPTGEINKLIKYAFGKKPPPVYRGEPIKMFFATQVETAPPTIVVFVNFPQRINFSYERYIRNCIRETYPFVGSDVRLIFKKRTEKGDRASEDSQS